MTSGRLEKETAEFKKIEEKINALPNVIAEYYYTMRAEKKSYATIDRYINSIKSFMEYVTNGKNNEDFYKNVNAMDVNKFMITLETKNKNGEIKPTSSSFRANKWYAINSFFEFLVSTGKLDINPVPKKSRPKIIDNPSVTYLTEKEVRGIMRNIRKKADVTIKNRDLCIFMLGVTTGLRISAITQINIEDIDFENNKIRVIEKRNKTFDAAFGESVKSVLVDWLEDRSKYYQAETNALFVSKFNIRLTDDSITYMLKKYSEGVTTKKVTPHVMRHTCATNLYEKTGDIYLTSAQLHHSSVKTTQRYAEISDEMKSKATSILDKLVK